MKLKFIPLITLLIALVGVIAWIATMRQTDIGITPNKDFITYRDQKMGLEISYPSDYQLGTSTNEIQIYKIQYSGGKTDKSLVHLTMVNADSPGYLSQHYEWVKSNFKENRSPWYPPEARQEVKINGVTYSRFISPPGSVDMRQPTQKTQMLYEEYFAKLSGRALWIKNEEPIAIKNQSNQMIIRSLKLLDK